MRSKALMILWEYPLKDKVFHRMFPRLQDRGYARGPMIAADHLSFLLRRPLDEVCRDGRLLAEGLLYARRLYGSDLVIVFSDISLEAEALGVKLKYSPDRNPHIIEQLLPGDVKVIDMPTGGSIPELFNAAAICRKELDIGIPVFFSMKDPFSLAALAIGTEAFLIALLEEPQMAMDLLEVCVENQLRLIDAVCSEGYIPLVGSPIASGSVIGPIWFHRFAEPAINRVLNRAEEADSFRCMHICGEVSVLIDQIYSLKLDLLSFEEWHAPMWELLQDTIPMGYLSTNLFVNGDEETIERATRECMVNMPEPFILSSGCDIPANSNPELVRRMMNVSLDRSYYNLSN